MDSALTEFLSRFGDSSNKTKDKSMSSPKPGEILLSEKELNDDSAIIESDMPSGLRQSYNKLFGGNKTFDDDTGTTNVTKNLGEKSSDVLDNVGDYSQIGLGAIELAGFAKGNQFNTDANSGGPGNGKGQIIQGATTGASMGKILGPIGMAGGAVVGGLVSAFAHKGAMKKWRKNQMAENTKIENEKTAKRKDEYAMSEGLASVNALKQLRERQLGIYTS